MNAAYFEKTGSLDFLRLDDRPVGQPAAGEVRVRVRAASLNPSDLKNVLGAMEGTVAPRIPGRDFAGVVEAGAAELLGQEVWGTGGELGFTRDGSHAEYLVVPAAGVAAKPRALSMEQAAAAGVSYVTAWLALMETARLAVGDTLLVTASRGGVGSAAVQLARWRGARVFGLNRSATQQDGLERSYTAASAEQYGEVREQVLEATGGRGVDVVFDTVGGALFEPCLKMLGHGGRQVNITSTGERRVSFDLIDFYHHRLSLFGADSRALDSVASAAILRTLAPLFEAGNLSAPQVSERFALREVVAAYRGLADKKFHGKAVLLP